MEKGSDYLYGEEGMWLARPWHQIVSARLISYFIC